MYVFYLFKITSRDFLKTFENYASVIIARSRHFVILVGMARWSELTRAVTTELLHWTQANSDRNQINAILYNDN